MVYESWPGGLEALRMQERDVALWDWWRQQEAAAHWLWAQQHAPYGHSERAAMAATWKQQIQPYLTAGQADLARATSELNQSLDARKKNVSKKRAPFGATADATARARARGNARVTATAAATAASSEKSPLSSLTVALFPPYGTKQSSSPPLPEEQDVDTWTYQEQPCGSHTSDSHSTTANGAGIIEPHVHAAWLASMGGPVGGGQRFSHGGGPLGVQSEGEGLLACKHRRFGPNGRDKEGRREGKEQDMGGVAAVRVLNGNGGGNSKGLQDGGVIEKQRHKRRKVVKAGGRQASSEVHVVPVLRNSVEIATGNLSYQIPSSSLLPPSPSITLDTCPPGSSPLLCRTRGNLPQATSPSLRKCEDQKEGQSFPVPMYEPVAERFNLSNPPRVASAVLRAVEKMTRGTRREGRGTPLYECLTCKTGQTSLRMGSEGSFEVDGGGCGREERKAELDLELHL